ncbi:MAG TPA: manganese efflux pump MntP family protein [Candidatus Omnitrophota bacterium]|nr:manganese efflux pump MntP family protein [Candidatus Omnitrophota bacterium]
MPVVAMVFIGLALSMDAFAVSVASGVIIKTQKILHAFKFAFSFGLFQMIMPMIGWATGNRFRPLVTNIDHWVAFGLLGLIGGKMIYEALRIESLEQAQKEVSLHVLLGLSVATSIDALVVGLSFAFIDVAIVLPVIIIGVITFAMSFAGFFIGAKLGHLFEKKVEIIAGLILIAIGFKILFEHLM